MSSSPGPVAIFLMLSYVLKSLLLADQRNFFHQQRHNLIFLLLEYNILSVLLYESLGQLTNQNIYFVLDLLI